MATVTIEIPESTYVLLKEMDEMAPSGRGWGVTSVEHTYYLVISGTKNIHPSHPDHDVEGNDLRSTHHVKK